MMKRLFAWVLLLFLLLTTGIALARSVGHRQPIPEGIALLHLTDCELPCWADTILGKTPQETSRIRIVEAFSSFDVHAPSNNPSLVVICEKNVSPDTCGIVVLTVASKGATQVIYIGVSRSGPRLGDIINFYGTPSCSVFHTGIGRIVANYNKDHAHPIEISVGFDRRDPFEPITDLILSNSRDEARCVNSDPFWSGFTSK
jgi:hypothetical protein